MIIKRALTRFLVLAICLSILTAPLAAQRRNAQPAAKAPARAPAEAATFENLLAADTYQVYGEIKNVGQVLRSPNVADVLDPLIKLASPPKEFKSLVKFARGHADALTTSRMLVAFMPMKPKVPQTVIAIEFASPEEAQKFEPELREFLPTVFPAPTPEAKTESDPASKDAKSKGTERSAVTAAGDPKATQDGKPAPLPFVITQTGSLVLISDTAFNIESLRPANSELLIDSANFREARDRFSAEPIFVFVNIALGMKRAEPTAEASGLEKQAVQVEPPAVEVKDLQALETVPMSADKPEDQSANDQFTVTTMEVRPPTEQEGAPAQGRQQEADAKMNIDAGLGFIFGGLMGGPSKWPDAVGVGVSLDSDSYAARVLLMGGPDGKASPIPFISQWVSGPPLTLQAPSVLPSDTELLIAASLDMPQIYEGVVRSMTDQTTSYRRNANQPFDGVPVAPFAQFEKRLGLKIKEDLLPLLGNEIAVSIPVTAFTGVRTGSETRNVTTEKDQADKKKLEPNPVILISLKDKDAARLMIPKIIDGLGFKGASMLAQKEKRDDTEIVSFAGAFSYAFIQDFLVLSPDAETVKHVVDSYLAHQTLGSESQYRNSTRWQPRQSLGQVYLSPVLMESYRAFANNPTSLVSDKIRDFMMHLSPVSEPVTYALSSEGFSPLHELRVPKNLVLMLVAGISEDSSQSPLIRNEQMTRAALMMFAGAEKTYQQNQGKGQYGSLDQLADHQLISKEMFREYGYHFEVIASGDKFTAIAVPSEYGKTGKFSYFVDQSGIVRGGDHGGAPATAADGEIQ